uniref:Uncharacterized protein n=1 Tax=Arundo donax TaxID=35708 RepID=A0A0A9AYL1_ARUDO
MIQSSPLLLSHQYTPDQTQKLTATNITTEYSHHGCCWVPLLLPSLYHY